MLEPAGFQEIKKILWKDIEPGMIILSGLTINNTIPHELRNYPALTVGQIYELTQKYHLRKEKEIVVAICKKGESPQKMSLGFARLESKLKAFLEFRNKILQKRKELYQTSLVAELQKKAIDNPHFVNQNYKFLNFFNSLEYKRRLTNKKPSLFYHLSENISIGEILSKSYKKKFFLPNEFSCSYFFGFSYDKNFKQENLQYVSEGYELLNTLLSNVLEKSKILPLGFSEEVQEIKYPFSGREVDNGKIFFTYFLKRVMHKKNKDTRNFAILSSFENPNDFDELWKLGEKFAKSQVDLCFLLTENTSLEIAKKLSQSFNANCIILKDKKAFPLVLSEIIDFYISEISLQLEPIEEVQFQEFSLPSFNSTQNTEEPKKEKVVKPFEFKKIKRGEK